METVAIEKIDPKKYGIKEETAAGIEQAFAPSISERKALAVIYDQLIKQEITPELCEAAKEFDKQLLQLEKNITAIHKKEKDYSLQYGRLCDAWKNKELAPVEQMRERMGSIKKHFELIEAARVSLLGEERDAELAKYGEQFPGLGEMTESVWSTFLGGIKAGYEAKLAAQAKAEAEAAEAARLAERKREREVKIAPFIRFLAPEEMGWDVIGDGEFASLLGALASREADYIAKQEAIRAEAEELRKKVALAAEIEMARVALIEAEKAEAEQLAKKPVKEQLAKWVESFQLQDAPVDAAQVEDIKVKFAAFKVWANNQVNAI